MSRGSALARRGGGGWSPAAGELHPFLATAALYIDASRNGGSGVNEGTAGSALDATGVAYGPGGSALFADNEELAATCPDAVDLDLTDGFAVAADLTVEWRPAVPSQILSKPTGTNTDTFDCYAVGFDGSGHPFIEWNDTVGGHNGPAFITGNGATADVTFDAGVAPRQLVYEFIADNGAGGWTARLYSGTPGATTLLSEMVNTTDGAQTLTTSGADLRIGDPLGGGAARVRLAATLADLEADPLRDFYPERDYVSGTTMTSATDEVWSGVIYTPTPAFLAATVADDAALDVASDADATLAFWFTTPYLADVDTEQYLYATRITGTAGVDGNGFQLNDIKLDAFALDGFGVIAGDGADQALPLNNTGWAAGTHLVVVTIDRATDTLTVYVDGVSHATADITSVGALDPAADLILASAAHHAVAKWDSVEDPNAIASVR